MRETKSKEREGVDMRIEEERYVIVVGGEIRIKVEMLVLPQDEPRVSDNMAVLCRIMLPAENRELVKELRFENRLEIAGEELYEDWGEKTVRGFRTRSRCFTAPRASEAWREAKEWVWGEVKKLDKALGKRARARKL